MQEGHLWTAFRYFDSDGNGTITRQELLDTLGNDDTQRSLSDSDFRDLYTGISEVLAKFDTDRDGNISFDEFVVMMCGMRKERLRTIPNTVNLATKPKRQSVATIGDCGSCQQKRRLRKSADGTM